MYFLSKNKNKVVFFRCRHGAIAKYFKDPVPTCVKQCDYCKDRKAAETALEHFKGDVFGNMQPGRSQGRTIMVVEDSNDMYGGGRRGVKR